MNNNLPQKDDWIRRYINGELSSEELETFNRMLETDETGIQLSEDLVRHYERMKLKNQLEDIHVRSGGKYKTHVNPLWKVAAAILILVLISLPFIYQSRDKPAEEPVEGDYFAEYFEPYRAPVLVRGDAASENWRQAVGSYQAGDYKSSIGFLNEYVQSGEGTDEAEFYLGVALLSGDPPEPEKAISILESVARGTSDYQQQAKWYLALAYWKAGDTDNFSSKMKEIANTPGYYHHAEARRIIYPDS